VFLWLRAEDERRNDTEAAATAVVRRGLTEARARSIYLDYLNRAQPHRRGARTAA